MTSLLQALIRQCWSPHAMGAIQGEQVGEQFALRSNEAWVSEERPSSQQHPSFLCLLSQIGCVYNTTRSKEQTQNVEGMGTSLLSSLHHCWCEGVCQTLFPSAQSWGGVRLTSGQVWNSLSSTRSTVKSCLLFVAKPLLETKHNVTLNSLYILFSCCICTVLSKVIKL